MMVDLALILWYSIEEFRKRSKERGIFAKEFTKPGLR
jgi:hypothetical protein